MPGGKMVLREVGRIGHTPDGRPANEEEALRGRKRRRQAFILVICASACWALVALLVYCFELTESFWPWAS